MIFRRRDFAEYDETVLNDVLQAERLAAGNPVNVIARFCDVPQGTANVNFLSGAAISFDVPASYESLERRHFFTNRWLCTWSLFAEVKRRYPELQGSCRLWLDDYPGGPGLAFCGNAVSHVLIPDSVFLETDGYRDARANASKHWWPWELRREVIFWRGTSTGMRGALHARSWRDLPRFRLCLLTNSARRKHLFDVGLSQIAQVWDKQELTEIEAAEVMRGEVPSLEFMKYRYSIDIDGNTCSWPGLMTKLIMGVTVLKVDSPLGFRQWYYDRLQPWVNFVPLSARMTELEEIAEWLMVHPEEAAAIAMRGRAVAGELTTEKVFDQVIPRIRASVR